ncbi:MAG: hypothetical protein E6J78_15110 [Deltaproteobacteria bacterium]|nr:MAG: hypothetical protein E6J78_15110 [Deltaproteobacteria bacterium]
MELWTVYDRPRDFPQHCAVRKVLVEEDGLEPADWHLFRSLQEARAALARRGLIPVPRGVRDDPALVETWL